MTRIAAGRALGLAVALLACRDEATPAPTLHTDTAGLSRAVDLPYGAGPVRWTVRACAPAGCGWVPGPTDTQLLACVALDEAGWGALAAKTRASASPASSTSPASSAPSAPSVRPADRLLVPESLAAMIFDPAQLATLPRDGEARVVEGPGVDVTSVTRRPFSTGRGVRWGDTLVVSLGTQ